MHEHLVEQPRDLGQVQADEIRVKKQGGIVWMAMASMVSTRLWLGGLVSPQRDRMLIHALVQKVRAGALPIALLFSTNGLSTYPGAVQKVFRDPVVTGKSGRPVLRPCDGICIVQMIKQYAQGRVVGVLRRIKQGTVEQVQALIEKSQGRGVINTAFIERLNGTFRARLTALVRKGRALARQVQTLHHGMYLIGAIYNFCTPHKSLCLAVGPQQWLARTPAMAAGISDHVWTVRELLGFRVPPPAWFSPKRRGRPSRALKRAMERWCKRDHD